MKGYLPAKTMVPAVYSDKPDEWRQWQEDVGDYFDAIMPGMKDLLKEAEMESEPIDREWAEDMKGMHGDRLCDDSLNVWRALKSLTTGARKVITSIRSEDGFRAWQRLHMRFGPSLASKQAQVLADFTGFVNKPAKSPDETRSLITEMERRAKMVEDVAGEILSELRLKSVLVGILDPMTRQHTAMLHGAKAKCEELKRTVLEFVNNVRGGGGDPMQIGRVEESHKDETGTEDNWDEHTAENSFIGVFGKGGTQCCSCGGYGHLARECPAKGKGKGKYGGKGKGWDRDFQKGKGKGKGQREE